VCVCPCIISHTLCCVYIHGFMHKFVCFFVNLTPFSHTFFNLWTLDINLLPSSGHN
uniref:Uncharacterized protein n=1 Tax=Astyanax mexicanus TaxID=7994 RepID=A0A3B1JY02_ASTMX